VILRFLLNMDAKITDFILVGYIFERNRQFKLFIETKILYITPWPECTIELYRPSDRRLSAKLVPTFADRRCHMVSVTDSYGHILDFLDRSRYFFLYIAPQLYSRDWVDPVPNPILLTKRGRARNRTRTSGFVARICDHQTTETVNQPVLIIEYRA
jgi:hypothetical protein